jgi:hypothetical protein
VCAVAVGALVFAASAGCGGEDEEAQPAASSPRAADVGEKEQRPAPESRDLPRAECPEALGRCRSASGRIVYVERVDPDGDGDAHFVLASDEEVTLPGISVIDVARGLRPHPLPGIGDYLSAAGPVHTGSYGQRQIEAVVVRVARSG